MSINPSNLKCNSETIYHNAILNMFPDIESFHDFVDDTPKMAKKSISRIIQFAYENELINSASEDEFINFIRINSKNNDIKVPEITFSELIDDITQKTSANSLINAMNIVADTFNMPNIQASMLSRLKKNFKPNTTKQKNIIRLLAFWIGKNRPTVGYNYQQILSLSNHINSPVVVEQDETEGIRIAISLKSCGDIIDQRAFDWLKTTLPKCLAYLGLNHINSKRINYTPTTVYLNISKLPGPIGEPRLYARAILDAVQIAHQISVRWLISNHSNQERVIAIAIDAGKFETIYNHMEALLSLSIPGNQIICMTHFARLCARLADVKIIFNETPKEILLLNGNYLSIWTVEFFWSYLYFDFIPELLDAEMLPVTVSEYEEFKKSLYFSNKITKGSKALSPLYKFPQNTLLALEIAKVLVSRKMLHEALSILSFIISSNPYHVVARGYRMAISRILYLNQENSSIADNYLLRAKEDSEFIEKYCFEDVETFNECALVFYSSSLKQIRITKECNVDSFPEEKQKLIFLLNNAQRYFTKGAAVAPVRDIRSECLLLQTKIILAIISTDESALNRDTPFVDRNQNINTISLETWIAFGWINDVDSAGVQNLLNHVFVAMDTHVRNVSLRAYLPCIKFSSACFMWDWIPIITTGLAKMIISLFEECIADVKQLEEYSIAPIANINSCTQVQEPGDFINKTQSVIDRINDIIQEDLLQNDDFEIPQDKINSRQLTMEHLIDFCDSKPFIK